MALDQVEIPEDAVEGITRVTAKRIGLISEDHNAEEDGSDLPGEVFEAFRGVDLIIHLGHMGFREILGRGVLDRLESVAPVIGVRDYSTDSGGTAFLTPPDGKRIAGLTRVIEAGETRIGAVHNLNRGPGPIIGAPPGGMPELQNVELREVLPAKFGVPVDVVAFAGTHRAAVAVAQGVLFVNPGSPTYPKGPGRIAGERALGTVGVLDVDGGVVTFELIELSTLKSS